MVDTTILCKPWDNSSGSANEQGGVVLCVKQALWEQQEGSPLPVPIRGCDWLYLDPWEEELFVWGIRRGSPKHPPSISPDFKAAHPINSYYLAGDLNPVCLTLEPMSFPSWTSKLLVKLSGILLCDGSFLSLSCQPLSLLCMCLHCIAPGHCLRREFISFSISICVVTLWWLREPKHSELIQALSQNHRMRQPVNGTE